MILNRLVGIVLILAACSGFVSIGCEQSEHARKEYRKSEEKRADDLAELDKSVFKTVVEGDTEVHLTEPVSHYTMRYTLFLGDTNRKGHSYLIWYLSAEKSYHNAKAGLSVVHDPDCLKCKRDRQ